MKCSIVINREFGSGGREIGRMLSERAGMEFYDTRAFQEAAVRGGLSGELLEDFDERVASGPYFDLSAMMGVDAESYAMPYRMYGAVAEVITEAARKAPAVFIGRCADRILADAGLRACSVFIYSTDLQRKVDRAVRVDGIPPKDAEKHIAKMDKGRARYQQFFTSTRFGDYRQYDLCLNSAPLGFTACVDIILAAASAES